jgi:hypothetical protein
MRRWVALLAVGGAFVGASSGCATAGKVRKERLQRDLDAFSFSRPLDEAWQEARRLLAERGYQLADKDAEAVGQRKMTFADRFLSPARETGPATEGGLLQRLGVMKGKPVSSAAQALDTGWDRYGERYHLEGWSQAGGSRVVFTRLKQDRTDRHSEEVRDLELELALVHRLDPTAASRIEQDLEAPPGK